MNIIESIYKEPEKWFPGEHYFSHNDGVKIWSANGFWFFQPVGGDFGLLDKYRAWRAYRWWCKMAPPEAFKLKTI